MPDFSIPAFIGNYNTNGFFMDIHTDIFYCFTLLRLRIVSDGLEKWLELSKMNWLFLYNGLLFQGTPGYLQ